MLKVIKLTAEQREALPRFRNEWLRWGTCIDRADRQRAEAAILAMRCRIGISESPIFVWVQSPAAGCLLIHFLKSAAFQKWINSLGASLRDSLGDSLGDSLWGSLPASLGDSLGASLRASLRDSLGASLRASLRASLGDSLGDSHWASIGASLRDSLRASLEYSLGDSLRASLRASLGDSLGDSLGSGQGGGGQHDSYWIAYYIFCRDVLGIEYTPEQSSDLNYWRDIAQSCCWWWCYRNYVIISERPTICKLDERGLIHGEGGPAVAFADGWAVHAWHGTRVPGSWIERRENLTAMEALAEPNTERRRAACEILGWDKILSTLEAKTINRDADPMIGELLEVDLPGSGRERFLKVLCGTGRTFALPVPPTVQTALEANAWTYGLDSASYKPEIRT